jgi:hypothetical protein
VSSPALLQNAEDKSQQVSEENSQQSHGDHIDESISEELDVVPVSEKSDGASYSEDVVSGSSKTKTSATESWANEADRGDDELEVVDQQQASSSPPARDTSRRSSAASAETVLESPRKEYGEDFKESDGTPSGNLPQASSEHPEELIGSVEESVEPNASAVESETGKQSDLASSSSLPDVIAANEPRVESDHDQLALESAQQLQVDEHRPKPKFKVSVFQDTFKLVSNFLNHEREKG